MQEDDACSAVLQSMLAFNNRALDSQQQQKLDSQLHKIQHSRQYLAAGQDMDGTVREVKRVDDPDIVQVGVLQGLAGGSTDALAECTPWHPSQWLRVELVGLPQCALGLLYVDGMIRTTDKVKYFVHHHVV